MRPCWLIAASVIIASAASAHSKDKSPANAATALATAARPAAQVVDAFHDALAHGDEARAAEQLADDAVIYEEGGAERTKAEYAAHHLPADAEFSKSIRSRATSRAGFSEGNLAWIATEGRMTGTFKGKALDRRTTETMVLRHANSRWKIVHIHWSSVAAAGDK